MFGFGSITLVKTGKDSFLKFLGARPAEELWAGSVRGCGQGQQEGRGLRACHL
jgi:hypothetical protein